MRILYNLGINLYSWIIRIISPFHSKAQLWTNGRKKLLSRLQQIFPATKPVVWIHCASLGEFEQGRPVIEKIRQQHPDYFILLTFFSPSGYEIRKNYALADHVCYLPSDTPRNAQKFIETVSPTHVYFVKYEFWRNYLHHLNKKDIPVYLISAIFRENQIFFRWYGIFFKQLLHYFRHIFVQDLNSHELLKNSGIMNVSVSGDTRFDRVYEIQKKVDKHPKVQQFRQDVLVLIAGSSWQHDENIVIQYWKEHSYKLKLIIAPHEVHTGNIKRIQALVGDRHILFSELHNQPVKNKDVLIVDTIGHLSSLYQYGDVAFIGGGFGKGIHNTLEAATFGLPVFFGPHHKKFKEAVDLIEHGGAFTVNDYHEFKTTFDNLVENPSSLKKASHICEHFVESNTGATAHILKKTIQK
jgi:3-deoxy-D-manno-octulosonic-acid transferase